MDRVDLPDGAEGQCPTDSRPLSHPFQFFPSFEFFSHNHFLWLRHHPAPSSWKELCMVSICLLVFEYFDHILKGLFHALWVVLSECVCCWVSSRTVAWKQSIFASLLTMFPAHPCSLLHPLQVVYGYVLTPCVHAWPLLASLGLSSALLLSLHPPPIPTPTFLIVPSISHLYFKFLLIFLFVFPKTLMVIIRV